MYDLDESNPAIERFNYYLIQLKIVLMLMVPFLVYLEDKTDSSSNWT